MENRRYAGELLEELSEQKFVLVSGPRQVGKTTLANGWLADRNGKYLTWDSPIDRQRILKNEPFAWTGSLVLDEIHKHARWKAWLKGLYDTTHGQLQVVVTGSARLDVFTRRGDSMFGRYELLRLHPLSLGEISHGKLLPPPTHWLQVESPTATASSSLDALETFGGFPEPFFRATRAFHTRWSVRRRDLLLREDMRELTQIREMSLLEHLWLLLPDRVGSPLSVNALREEIQVAHETASSWLDVFDRLYLTFRLAPYVSRSARSLRKERKLYLWDWSQLQDPGARFENLVASHLLKSVHAWNDAGFGDYDLAYYRDREKREVDFVITERRKPVVLIEAKLSDEALSPHLLHLSELLKGVPMIQVVRKPGVDTRRGNARIVSADRFLSGLC